MELADGFEDQRLCVVPRPRVTEALDSPITRRMVVTDAGYFPRARNHGRHRPNGASETVVIVCVSGSGWVQTEGARVRVTASTAVIIPGGVPHDYGASDDDPWSIWWCHVRGTDVAELVAEAGITPAKTTLSLRALERITSTLDEIVSALERDQSPVRLIATAGMAWRLLSLFAIDSRVQERGDPLDRALRYLDDRVDGTIRVAELANLVGVSPSHLSALFRNATGGGVLAHHTALKMARARRLLDTTTMSISEIGREVGMADQFYFSRQFRRTHGVSPTTYRAQRKG
jgi:AraC family transcriptional regulator, arabinose operon regulatory protein